MESSNSAIQSNVTDGDNLQIIIRPRPPRRRQSGISLIPFRPYVKCLTSVRQPFSFANGFDPWKVIGNDQIFFTQSNARCIGTLIDDCHISDIIQLDIQSDSTLLPMMCKLWIITDGAIVERGKPHLVQDAAVQVFTAGRHLRSLFSSQSKANEIYEKERERNVRRRLRRQSWHDLNEYHSVPYYQYTHILRLGSQQSIQCDLDQPVHQSEEKFLSLPEENEEILHEKDFQIEMKKDQVQQRIHQDFIPEERLQISMITQTDLTRDRSTSTDSQLIRLFNLNFETNEILLSSIVNPYRECRLSTISSEYSPFSNQGKEYRNVSQSTGDDFPSYWRNSSTDFLLSDRCEEKEKIRFSSPLRTDEEFLHQINGKRKHHPSSSSTMTNHYEIHSTTSETTRERTSSKFSDPGYQTFLSSSNANVTNFKERKCSSSSSTDLLTNLLQRYDKTFRERQRSLTILDQQMIDIDQLLRRYREKLCNSSTINRSIQNSHRSMDFSRDLSILSEQSNDNDDQLIRKYRSMPGVTSEEMLQGYIPSPRLSFILSTRQRSARFHSSIVQQPIRTDYCNLCLNDHQTNSAWIRYNERRIEELQKRIDLMLTIDDQEEAQLLLTPIHSNRTKSTPKHIDQLLPRKSRPSKATSNRFLDFDDDRRRFSPRMISSLPTTPRTQSRNGTRPTTPLQKSVRISSPSSSPPPPPSTIQSSSSRPIVSILRRNSVPSSKTIPSSSHVWKSKVDGKVYVLEQFSIPRYYRLYNDVSFRDMFQLSRVLDTYLPSNETNIKNYSSILKNFALDPTVKSSCVTTGAT